MHVAGVRHREGDIAIRRQATGHICHEFGNGVLAEPLVRPSAFVEDRNLLAHSNSFSFFIGGVTHWVPLNTVCGWQPRNATTLDKVPRRPSHLQAVPEPPPSAAQKTTAARPESTLSGWLAQRSDEQLQRLLRTRIDVATPAPQTLDTLAARLQYSDAANRAADMLDLPTATVLVAAQAAGAATEPISLQRLLEQLPYLTAARRPAAVRRRVTDALDTLRDHGLIWGDDKHLNLVAPLSTARITSQVVLPRSGEPVGADLIALLKNAPEQARAVVERIASGDVPRGTLPTRNPEALRAAIASLTSAGALDVQAGVVTARAHTLYYQRFGTPATDILAEPQWPGSQVGVAQRDGAAAVAAIEVDHVVTRVLDVLDTAPLHELRSGGIGIREMRRLATQAGIDVDECVILVEILASAELLAPGDAVLGDETLLDVWAPTPAADAWRDAELAARIAWLAAAWWLMPRRPQPVGAPAARLRAVDPATNPKQPEAGAADSTQTSLHVLMVDHVQPRAPRERADMAAALQKLPQDRDTTETGFRELVRWTAPIYLALRRIDVLYDHLEQARLLGLVSGWGLSTVGRTVAAFDAAKLDPDAEPAADLRERLTAAFAEILPAPIAEIIVQADHTILAPGPLTSELALAVGAFADIESAGAATTYRITEKSVRRALDSGGSAAEIIALLERISLTPVPQAVVYLIEDTARRHGTLRVGSATTFLRSDDTALIAELAAGPLAGPLALRMLAPTVLISELRPRPLLTELRRAGYAPLAEDATGKLLSVSKDRARIDPAETHGTRYAEIGRSAALTLSTEAARRAVAVLRSAQRAGDVNPSQRRTGEAALALLHTAADRGQTVSIAVVDSAGRTSTTLLLPLQVGAGRVAGINPMTGEKREHSLHRVISVTPAT